MAKISKIDLILQEMKQGFNQVNTRLDNLEKDVTLIKQCPTIKQELNDINISE